MPPPADSVAPQVVMESEPTAVKPELSIADKMSLWREKYALTPRETEVLAEIIQETGIAEMAVKLGIKERTVKFHISSLLRKTGTQNQPELRLQLKYDLR